MRDPRVERLATLLVEHSLGLRPGDVVRVDGLACAAPLAVELGRAALAAGAHPYTALEPDDLAETVLAAASDDQLEFVSPIEQAELERLDALVTIWAEQNTRALSNLDPARVSRRYAARRALSMRRWERIAAGELRWVGTLQPTAAHAQDAGMALEEYEAFVFHACRVDDPDVDPVAAWRGAAARLQHVADELASVSELRIVGEDTDVRVSVAGRHWIAADGRLNMPDGEVFTSPVETSAEGEIRFRLPAIFAGREVEDVRLRFSGGEVVSAEAAHGQDYLDSLLAIDGARLLGEVAFGLNYGIDRFTHNILLDEKIGGTMHLALGAGFAQAGGRNTSSLHLDLICDLREEGEVYGDGALLWRAGRFLDRAGPDA